MRYWRVVGNFHTVGEVADIVSAPNWIGGIRKGTLAIRRNTKLKGRKITSASFIIQEATEEMYAKAHPLQKVVNEVLPLASEAQVSKSEDQTPEPKA